LTIPYVNRERIMLCLKKALKSKILKTKNRKVRFYS
jgi:hypothetical protein